jgi:hypothetical protein
MAPLFETVQGPEVEAVALALTPLKVILGQLRTVLGD